MKPRSLLLGLTLTLSASVPLLTDRLHEQFDLKSNLGISHNLHGPSEEVFNPIYLSSTPTPHGAGGIGDLQVGAALSAFVSSRHSLVVRVGVKAPANIARYLAGVGETTEGAKPDLGPARSLPCTYLADSPDRGPPHWKSRVLRLQALGDEEESSGSQGYGGDEAA